MEFTRDELFPTAVTIDPEFPNDWASEGSTDWADFNPTSVVLLAGLGVFLRVEQLLNEYGAKTGIDMAPKLHALWFEYCEMSFYQSVAEVRLAEAEEAADEADNEALSESEADQYAIVVDEVTERRKNHLLKLAELGAEMWAVVHPDSEV